MRDKVDYKDVQTYIAEMGSSGTFGSDAEIETFTKLEKVIFFFFCEEEKWRNLLKTLCWSLLGRV